MIKTLLALFLFFIISQSLALENQAHLVDMDFQKISVRELLQFLAESMNSNLIMSENVSGFISIHLKNVTWKQAFDGVLEMMGLVKRELENLLLVGTPNEFLLRQKRLAEAVPVTFFEFSLKHVDVMLAETLLRSQSDIFSTNLKITAMPLTNKLIIKDTVNNIPQLKTLLKEIDQPVKQIIIQAKIINIDNSKVQELGLHFNEKSSKKTKKSMPLSLPTSVVSGLHFAVASAAQNPLLNLQLDALQAAGHSALIADPKIITQNRKQALIESGEEIPYQESTSSGATNTTFKKAVLCLKVKPLLLPDGRINMELEVNQNKVSTLAVNGTPAIQTQEVKAEVTIREGETVVLGGIFEKAATLNKNELPFISRLPVVGVLFSHQHESIKTKQLLILITPTIMNND